jgi:hypothetical protein
MTLLDLLNVLPTLALAIVLAASAGVRAWLPLLAVGVLARLDVIQLGNDFLFLASTQALVLFGVATVIEIVADKVPALDHGLDAVSTFVRPAAGALLTAGVMWQVNDPMWATILGIAVGAPVAAAPHVAKSALRLVSSATTAGLANPVVSLIEDVLAALLVVLAVVVPIAALVSLIVVAWFGVRVWRRRRSLPAQKTALAHLDAQGFGPE